MTNTIHVQGARANNLKNVSVSIPRDKLVVLTGLSGSGKSSLAFDTIYAEGQRRYVESPVVLRPACFWVRWTSRMSIRSTDSPLPSPSTRRRRADKPALDRGYGDGNLRLSAPFMGAVSARRTARSCGKEIRRQTIDQIVDQVMGCCRNGRGFRSWPPVVRGKKGDAPARSWRTHGARAAMSRVRVDGSLYDL